MIHEYCSESPKSPKPETLGYLPILKIIAFFDKRRKIVLLNSGQSNKEQYLTITYGKQCYFCKKIHAPVYPATRVGDVVLEENGKIGKDSSSFYIDSWEYYNKEKR